MTDSSDHNIGTGRPVPTQISRKVCAMSWPRVSGRAGLWTGGMLRMGPARLISSLVSEAAAMSDLAQRPGLTWT